MPTLQIEHVVPNYEGWKKAFESDPINRKSSGVKRYRIYRPVNDMNLVIVELDFDNMDELQSTLQALQLLWNKVQGSVMVDPKTRILEIIESKEV
ncbi:MAG: hypothetical protein KTQ13_11775 [Ferruginibacter sp.]|nr:hypothetical protein [Chitinophagaceae bacterium]MBU9937324.1 hypothetical protein [Ferruginibacter sp.]